MTLITPFKRSWIFGLFTLILALSTISVSEASLNDSLIHGWTFNQSSGNLVDYIGSLDLEVWRDNPTEEQAGMNGYSVLFDGNDAYYQNGGTWSPSSDMTICIWIKFTDIDRLGSISGYDRGGSNNGDWNYLSHSLSAGMFQFWIQNTSHSPTYVYTDESPPNNEWEFNCVYWGGGKYGMWRNGTRQEDEATYPAIPEDTYFTIGADRFPDYYVKSYIDEYYIWERVLSDQEVSDLWNNGDGFFLDNITSANITPNTPPTIDSPINITASPVKDQDIRCNFTPRDDDSDTVNVTVTWYENDSIDATYDYVFINPALDTISSTGSSTGSWTGSTSKGSEYVCQMTINDDEDSNNYNSSASTVINTDPTIDDPINITADPDPDQDIHCSYTPRDIDSDTVNVSITWYVDDALDSGYDYDDVDATLDSVTTTTDGTGSFTGSTSKGEQINCQMTITDDEGSNVYNSSKITVGNTAPTIDDPINITVTPVKDQDIHCSYTPRDEDADSVNVSITWYVDDVLNSGYDYNDVDATLDSVTTTTDGTGSFTGSTTKGSEYLCQMTINDGVATNSYNSSATTVINSDPTIDDPINITATPVKDQDIHCSYTPRDEDADSVNVSITWYVDDVLNSGYDYNDVDATLDSVTTTTDGTGSFTGSTTKGSEYLCQMIITDNEASNSYNSSITTVINSAPTVSSHAIWIDPPLFNPLIECGFVPADNDSDTVNVSVTWYKNDTLVSDYDYSFIDPTLDTNITTGSGTGSATDTNAGNEWICELTITDAENVSLYNSTVITSTGIPLIEVNMTLKNGSFLLYDYLDVNLEEYQFFYVMANYTHDSVSTQGAECIYWAQGLEDNISMNYNTSTAYYDNLDYLHELNFSGTANVTIYCNETAYYFDFGVDPFIPLEAIENVTTILKNETLQVYDLEENMTEDQYFYVMANYTVNNISNDQGVCKYFVDGITPNNITMDYNLTTELYENHTQLYQVNITGNYAINTSVWCNETLYSHSVNVTPFIPVNVTANHTIIIMNQSLELYDLFENMTRLQDFYVMTNYSVDNVTNEDGDCKYFVDGITPTNITLSYNGTTEIYENRTYLHDLNFSGTNVLNLSVWCNETLQDHTMNVTEPPTVPTVTIHVPINDSVNGDDPLNFTFETNFDFYQCALLTNYSGSWTEVDQIGTSEIVNIRYEPIAGYRLENNYLDEIGTINGSTVGDPIFLPARGGNGTGSYSVSVDNNDYVNLGQNFNFTRTDAFSFSAWVNTTDTLCSFMSHYNDATDDGFIAHFGSDGKLLLKLYDTAGKWIETRTDHAYNIEEWVHYTAVYNGSSCMDGLALFVNGSEVPQTRSNSGGCLTGSIVPARSFQINCRDGANICMIGQIDEVGIYNYSLNITEARELYNNGWVSSFTEFSAYTNYTNLTHNLPPNTITDIEYYISCNSTEPQPHNSSVILVHYNNDYYPPEIIFTAPTMNDTTVNRNIDINFTTNEIANCSINDTAMNEQYTNGSVFWFRETILGDGSYTFNITCNDTALNENSAIINITKDTTDPVIIWYKPVEENITTINFNETFFLNMNFQDSYLFAYEVLVYDPSDDLRYNFTEIGITTTSKNLIEPIIPDTPSTWRIEATVSDSHTKKEIPDYKYDKIGKNKVTFKFDKEINKKNKQIKREDVTIEYIGDYGVTNTEIKKQLDRYGFVYSFDKKTLPEKGEVEHKFQIVCDDLYYVPDSEYIAHFVCWESKNWIDFENPAITRWSYIYCNSTRTDCYNITLYTNASTDIEFNSIGGLNIIEEHAIFTVYDPSVSPITGFSIFDFTLDTTSNVMLLFVIAFLWLGVMILAFFFKNFGFASVGFFLGCVLGLLFAGLHIFLTLVFLLLNISIFVIYAVKLR